MIEIAKKITTFAEITNMKLGSIIFFFLLTGSFLNATTKEVSSLNDTIALNELVVSATKTAVNRSEIPLTMSVIQKQTIDESVETGVLSILSEHVPGLFVTERGVTGYGVNNGSAGMVNIHGVGGGNKVLMLFDGQPNWAGIFGHAIPDAYVASDAERVEVIRGPASLLYGSNAMGGVINVITRKASEEGFHGRARAMYGAYDTWKMMGNAGYKHDKFHATLSLNRDQSTGHRPYSAFDINNGYLKIGYQFSNHWETTANSLIADFEIHNPGTNTWTMYENWAKALRTTHSVSLNHRYEKISGSIQVFYNQGKHHINDGHSDNTIVPESETVYFNSVDFNKGIAWFESFHLIDNNTFTIGIDLKQWGGKAWNEKAGTTTSILFDNQKINERAGYIVVQQTLFDRLSLNTGFRLENNEQYGNEWVPQAGLSYQLHAQSTLKFSASKGFRSPNINEMYNPWGSANSDLKPEKMYNYDFSYSQTLFSGKLNFEGTAFYAKGKNLILPPAMWGAPNNNSGQFANKGFDFGFQYQILPTLRLSGNYSYLLSDIKIPAAPKHKAFLQARWKIGKFLFIPSMQSINGLYLSAYTPKSVPSEFHIAESYQNYTLLNCKITYEATPQLQFFIHGENLTGATYQIYSGYPMPNTVVLAGFDVKF